MSHIGAASETELAGKEKEPTESRTAVMLGQIQLHFLINTLSAIRVLCRKNPEKAEQATAALAEFLRGNMDSLTADKPVPFERELAHTQNYLNIELLRFPKRLHIRYDLGATSFCMPTLTLQPLVENAVRHGIAKRAEGGTITIATRETDSAYIVTVSDDGVGYSAQTNDDGRTHIGIQNVRMRLAAMCGGTLDITGAPSAGTEASIRIPKGEDECLSI